MTSAKTDCLAGSLLSPTERAAAIRAKRDAILGWFRPPSTIVRGDLFSAFKHRTDRSVRIGDIPAFF